MYQPIDLLEDGKVLNSVAAFERSIHGSVLRVLRDDVYIQGEMGWFLIGRLRGGNEIEIGHNKIVDKYRRLLEDKIKETKTFVVAQKVVADWL